MPIPKQEKQFSRLSAKEQVFQTLKEWIVDGTLKPGEPLNDLEIAGYFSVSRTPVREAVLLLAQQGLVDVIPSRGTRVSRADADMAFSIYEALAELSASAARLACQKQAPGDTAELRRLNASFADAAGSGRRALLIQTDNAFHAHILKMAANPYLIAFAEQLNSHVYRYEALYFSGGEDRTQSVRDHDRIIDALESRSEEAAARFSRQNWLASCEALLNGALKNGAQP